MRYTTIDTPIGELLLVGDEGGLRRVSMSPFSVAPPWARDDEFFDDASGQFGQYFRGERREFDLPLKLEGNSFELLVWDALREIPYGETVSYGHIARGIGHPDAPRAVGAANGRNPVAIIVPCHRVIGADGSLTGYGGGLDRKRFLLDLEAGAIPMSA
jgi:methylated-DNA-[protein]-cysteine S-methyltransferase